jgi:hypothetical protein
MRRGWQGGRLLLAQAQACLQAKQQQACHRLTRPIT